MNEKALGLLGLSQKGGNVVIGEDPVGTSAKGGKARLIILAADAAENSMRRAGNFAGDRIPLIVVDGNKDALGAIFGRTSVAMLAITDIALAQRFLELLGEPERYGKALTAVREKKARMEARKQRRPGGKKTAK